MPDSEDKPTVYQNDDQERAAEKRAEAAKRAEAGDERAIEALLWERKGYVVRGLDDRVAAVDASLAALGYEVEKPAPKPRTRKASS